jgi:hypothetical protein
MEGRRCAILFLSWILFTASCHNSGIKKAPLPNNLRFPKPHAVPTAQMGAVRVWTCDRYCASQTTLWQWEPVTWYTYLQYKRFQTWGVCLGFRVFFNKFNKFLFTHFFFFYAWFLFFWVFFIFISFILDFFSRTNGWKINRSVKYKINWKCQGEH